MEIYLFTNKIWEKIFKIFGIKNLDSAKQALNLKNAIIFTSDDRVDELKVFENKLQSNDVIITILPSNVNSNFNRDELKSLISKALGLVN
jgi:hypothetical protein